MTPETVARDAAELAALYAKLPAATERDYAPGDGRSTPDPLRALVNRDVVTATDRLDREIPTAEREAREILGDTVHVHASTVQAAIRALPGLHVRLLAGRHDTEAAQLADQIRRWNRAARKAVRLIEPDRELTRSGVPHDGRCPLHHARPCAAGCDSCLPDSEPPPRLLETGSEGHLRPRRRSDEHAFSWSNANEIYCPDVDGHVWGPGRHGILYRLLADAEGRRR